PRASRRAPHQDALPRAPTRGMDRDPGAGDHRPRHLQARPAGPPREPEVEPGRRRARALAAARPDRVRPLPCRLQLPQDARPQRHVSPVLLMPQPRHPARRRRALRCPERNIRADELDAYVFAQVRRALLQPAQLIAGERTVITSTPPNDDDLIAAQLATLERKLEQ